MEWEKIFANYIAYERFISKIYKDSYNSLLKNNKYQIKN